jgi:hypothetical protein
VAPEKSSSQKAAAIVSDLVQAWIDEAQGFYDALNESNTGFAPEDVTKRTDEVVGRLRPIIKRGIELNLELLRPWSTAFTNAEDADA